MKIFTFTLVLIGRYSTNQLWLSHCRVLVGQVGQAGCLVDGNLSQNSLLLSQTDWQLYGKNCRLIYKWRLTTGCNQSESDCACKNNLLSTGFIPI